MVYLISFVLLLTGCAGAGSDLRWNIYERRFETATTADVLKYNYYSQTWSYQPEDSKIIWNPYESRYEWGRQ